VSNNVRLSTRQLVFASALLAAWQMLGGGSQALADYVSATYLSRGSDVLFTSAFAPGSWEHECVGGVGSSDARNEKQSPEPSDRERPDGFVPFAGLFQTAWQMGSDGGTSSSSGSSSVSGPSSQYIGGMARFDFLLIEVEGLVPPQTGDTHPFSLASFLFRPPRLPS